MTPGIVLLGLGIGALLVANRGRSREPSPASLRDRTIEAQQIAAQAALRARELAAQLSAEEGKR